MIRAGLLETLPSGSTLPRGGGDGVLDSAPLAGRSGMPSVSKWRQAGPGVPHSSRRLLVLWTPMLARRRKKALQHVQKTCRRIGEVVPMLVLWTPMLARRRKNTLHNVQTTLQKSVKRLTEHAQQKHDNADSIHSSQNQCKVKGKRGTQHGNGKTQMHC